MPTSHQPITIFSGGSAANSLAPIFTSLSTSKSCSLAYIIPISDNGGSSSELIRVFGGPGIGDVRSRLVRLIPRLSKSSPGWREREGIRSLLSYRLSSTGTGQARNEWNDVVDGTSLLWKDITSAKKELIRSIFNLVNLEIIKRSRPPGSTFDFTSASVGNLFLTGARLFTGSFESAIYLMGSICGINDEDVKVVPSINSNFSHHIAAGLEDGSVIVGQNAISHPTPEPVGRDQKVVAKMTSLLIQNEDELESSQERRPSAEHYYGDEEGRYHDHQEEVYQDQEEDAHLPGTLPTLRTKNITFNKNENEELPAKVSRIWYINPYGQEILPPANPRAIAAISNASAIIYSIGSLYTSLVPSLILRGVGDAIRKATSGSGSRARTKILILNGSLDREVGPQPSDPNKMFSALDFVEAVVRAGEQSRGVIWEGSRDSSQTEKQVFLHPTGQSISPTQQRPVRPGLHTTKSESSTTTMLSFRQPHHLSHLFPAPLPASSTPSRDPSPSSSPTLGSSADHSASETSTTAAATLTSQTRKIDPIYNAYITHIIHLPNSISTPHVDRDLLLRKCGIQTVKVYGRRESEEKGGAMLYDHAALRGAIEAILGRNPDKSVGSASRKNTGPSDVGGDDEADEDETDEDVEGMELTRTRTKEEERRRLKSGGRRNTVDSY